MVFDGRSSGAAARERRSASNANLSSCTCAAHAAATAHVPGSAGSKPLAAYATPYRAAHRRYFCALCARAASSGSRLDPATSPPIAGRNHAANPNRGRHDTNPATPQRRPESSSSESGVGGPRVWELALRAGRAKCRRARPRTPEPRAGSKRWTRPRRPPRPRARPTWRAPGVGLVDARRASRSRDDADRPPPPRAPRHSPRASRGSSTPSVPSPTPAMTRARSRAKKDGRSLFARRPREKTARVSRETAVGG